MTMNSINKGKAFEREVAQLLTQRTGIRWQRVPHSGALATSQGIQDKNFRGDLFCENNNFSKWVIECKITGKILTFETLMRTNSLLWKWWTQACSQRSAGQDPVLIFRYRGSPIFILCYVNYTATDTDILTKFGAMQIQPLGNGLFLGRLTE